MKSICLSLIVFVLLALPAGAQEHKGVVVQVKDAVRAAGLNISGPCGAFEITKRVAWLLRGEGAGLLGGKSGTQNRCGEYATDIIQYADGRYYDILIDSGGANEPNWGSPIAGDMSLWRPAMDPGDTPVPPPVVVPPVTPAPPTIDYPLIRSWIENAKAEVYTQNERMFADEVNRLDSLEKHLTDHDSKGVGNLLTNRTFWETVAAGVGAIILTIQTTGKP